MKIQNNRKMERFTMFEINGIYGVKFMTGGQVIRNKSTFKQYLNTEAGVMRFIEEMQPFDTITIKDMTTKEDKTEYFLGPKEKK